MTIFLAVLLGMLANSTIMWGVKRISVKWREFRQSWKYEGKHVMVEITGKHRKVTIMVENQESDPIWGIWGPRSYLRNNG